MSLSHVLSGIRHSPKPRQTSAVKDSRVCIDATAMASAIAVAGPRAWLPAILLAQAHAGFRLACSGIRYLAQGSKVREVYGRISPDDFQAINARQAWANWRTIPRNLHGNLPTDRPLQVLDLCCGTGDSLCVLAWWLPSGSTLIGIEADARFAELARKGRYRNYTGAIIPVTVHHGSVLDAFCDRHGRRLEDGSIDVVHAIGSIGCHFTPRQSEIIVRECARVLVPTGFAMLDTGDAGTSAAALTRIAAQCGLVVTGRNRSCWFDRYEQLVLRFRAEPGNL